jgi:regulator of replication initiation timing
MPQLVFRYDDGGVESFSLDADVIGVGRLGDNSIVIDNDYISGHHARLLREPGGGYRIFDLNSNNGTYVNDRLISEHILQHGETIRFGVFEVQYWHIPVTPAEPVPVSEPEPSPAVAEAEAELLRLEARRAELQILLVQEHRKFEELKDRAVPDLESQVNALKAEIDQLRRQRDEAKTEFDTLQLRLQEVRDSLGTTTRELEGKRAALSTTVNELMTAESSRDEAKREHEELRSLQDRAATALDAIQQERDQLVAKNKAIVAAVAEAETNLSSLRRRIETETVARVELERENEELRQRASLARDRLQMAEARVLGKIRDWNEFETNQLTLIVERKSKLEEQCSSAEARLSKARDELADLRDRMRSETDGSSAALQDLRINHYEPTKELHEELTLRNEELANEIARKEQKLRQLELAIREGRETEQIVSSTLEQKGQVLENLEQRIGEEVSRIAASVISLQRPASSGKPPRLADFGEIFVPSSAPAPLVPISTGRNSSGRTSLIVFDPNAQARSADFTGKVELEIEEAPLPVGFMGLAAATRGAFFTSLARTVEANRPVLLVTGEDLQETHSQLKKLRAALPSQVILLGWRSATFVKVTECLHAGTNFQDLLAMLAISDGSLTTDPYMNTFFESLNQAKRFLYLPPALPWNPKPRIAHGTRSGIYVDITAFQPEAPAANSFIADLKGIVESTRQLLTIPEVSRARARRLQERLELGADWTRIIPVPDYRELLATLGKHLAIASFEETGFDHPLLRDALLTGTLLLAPGGAAYQTFFPKLAQSATGRTYADPALVAKLFDSADDYDETMQGVEKALVEGHSYQAACRQIDTFMNSLRR